MSGTRQSISKSAAELAIENGRILFGSDVITGVLDDGIVNFLIVTGSVQPLVTFAVTSIGDYELELYEDTTVSADGTAYTNFNLNRASSNAAETVVNLTPTITGDGTLIVEGLINGGNKNSATGSESEGGMVLKTASNYLFRFTNRAGITVSINPSWTILE